MKKYAKKKDDSIKIDASFEELVKMSVEDNPKPEVKSTPEKAKMTMEEYLKITGGKMGNKKGAILMPLSKKQKPNTKK